MKIKIISTMVIAALCFSFSAFAEDNSAGGTIYFNGAISDTTCTINGNSSANMTVDLSPISVTDAGTTVGIIQKNSKTISLTFSGCQSTGSQTGIKLHLSSTNNISNDGKYLLNTTVNESNPVTARNVGFAITKQGEAQPIQLNQPLQTEIAGNEDGVTEVLNLDVYYYKTNTTAATVGSLASNLIYTVSYL